MERTKSILGTERLEQLQQQGGLGSARRGIPGMALSQLNRLVSDTRSCNSSIFRINEKM